MSAPPPNDAADAAALAAVVARVAAETPGVARLIPGPVRAARQALRTMTRATDDPAAAVDVVEADGRLVVTVRLAATGTPPVLDTVREVQRRVAAEVDRAVVVAVQVLDLDFAVGSAGQ